MAHRKLSVLTIGVSTAAALSAVALFLHWPFEAHDSAVSIALLSTLAIIAEFLSFMLPNSARGSIAFIPYLAMAVVVPGWAAIVAIVAVRSIVEVVRRTPLLGALFNTAQHALTLSVAIWVYLGLGGQSMLDGPSLSLLRATSTFGIPAIAAFAASFLANGVTACSYLALQKGQRVTHLWRQMVLPTIALDMVAAPMVFVFAWLYATHGAIAASALWVPLLGLREVHRVNLELRKTNEELLQLMIKSIEARDLYTSGHSKRVQHFSILIARSLGLSERDVEQVGKAALLHDVGKIYDKYAPILRKPDKLTPDEWATMQEHPIDGANLVATMSGLKEVVPAVRHHHENWDGTGYPDGLAGNAIPLPARIITFADTIDAMTSERPYRRPMSQEQVRAEIVRCRGHQFDPQIADRLLGSPMWSLLFTPATKTVTPRKGLAIVRSRAARESA